MKNLYKGSGFSDESSTSKHALVGLSKPADGATGALFLASVEASRLLDAGHLLVMVLDKGVDLRYLQDLLGQESSKTTEIYTHIVKESWDNIKSPLDDWEI